MGAKPAKARSVKDVASGKKFDENGRELIRVFLVENYTKPSGAMGLRKKFVWRDREETMKGLSR